jgi:arginine utilization protein RocB
MKKIYLVPFAIAALALAKTEWKPLFNGKTFEPEWYIAGDKSYWKIEDSAIVGKSTNNTPYTIHYQVPVPPQGGLQRLLLPFPADHLGRVGGRCTG